MIKKLIKSSILFSAISLLCCVSATVTVPDVCNTTLIGNLPAAPAPDLSFSGVSLSVPIDLSKAIIKINDLSNGVDIEVTQLSLDGDVNLQWVETVDVTIKNDFSQDVLFATYKSNGTGVGTKISMTMKMDAKTAILYLSSPATLTFTMSGTIPTEPVVLNNTLCVKVIGQFDKSL